MSADECRAKANELSKRAEAATSYAATLEREAVAIQCRRLALFAEWQDTWDWQEKCWPEAPGS